MQGERDCRKKTFIVIFHSTVEGYCILFLDEQWRKSILGVWQTPEVSGVRVREYYTSIRMSRFFCVLAIFFIERLVILYVLN